MRSIHEVKDVLVECVSIHAVDIIRQITCRRGVLCMTLDTRSIIYPQERRLFFSVSTLEGRRFFCPSSPLLRLLLYGLAGPEVLPPLLQHVGVKNDRT